MRDVVYLSRRKLQRFGQPRGPFTWVNAVKGVIKTSIAELSVEAVVQQRLLRQAETVVKGLRKRDRAPVWFTENVENGSWVRFVAPMAYTTIRNAAVFMDDGEPSETYPTGGQVRLLLHGSSEHLIGVPSTPHTSVEELSQQASEYHAKRYYYPVHADCWASPINHFLDLIEFAAQEEGYAALAKRERISFETRLGATDLDKIIPVVERRLRLPHTSMWMTGYAEVTAIGPSVKGGSIVMATPLYVERISSPA